jgi:serine/threonine protein kinase
VFESTKHLLMVMEFADGGDLLHFVKKVGRINESDSKYIFKQVVEFSKLRSCMDLHIAIVEV